MGHWPICGGEFIFGQKGKGVREKDGTPSAPGRPFFKVGAKEVPRWKKEGKSKKIAPTH